MIYDIFHALGKVVPNNFSRQVSAPGYIREHWRPTSSHNIVLDLGCGEGDSFDLFHQISDRLTWIGVDIASSYEVAQRTRKGLPIVTYDGVNLPLGDNRVDLIYSNQAFEHVRHPGNITERPLLTHSGHSTDTALCSILGVLYCDGTLPRMDQE